MSRIHHSAVLVRKSITIPAAMKRDSRGEQVVADAFDTSDDAGRYMKQVIPASYLKRVKKIANTSRTRHYDLTLKTTYRGSSVLMLKLTDRYFAEQQELENMFWAEVNELKSRYWDMRDDAKRMQGELFNPLEFPDSPTALGAAFGWSIRRLPLPDDAAFSFAATDDLRNEVRAEVADLERTIKTEMWHRLHTAVKHMAEKLSDPEAKFHNTLVENVKAIVDLLPDLNYDDDVDLDRLAREVRYKLSGHNPDVLRTDAGERELAAQNARALEQAIMANLPC